MEQNKGKKTHKKTVSWIHVYRRADKLLATSKFQSFSGVWCALCKRWSGTFSGPDGELVLACLLTENVHYNNNNETFKYSKGPLNNKVQCHLPATEVPQTFRIQPVRFHGANRAVMQDVTIEATHIYLRGPAKAEQKL